MRQRKLFIGATVRRLRSDRGWRLDACAARLGLSPSYLSQIETNQRPVTARVLIDLARTFEVDIGALEVDDDGRLVADMREATMDLAAYGPPANLAEIKQAVQVAPGLARQFLGLHHAFRRLDERLKALDEAVSLDETAAASALLPYEEVRDFFHYKDNYIDSLDRAAEQLFAGLEAPLSGAILARLRTVWEIEVVSGGPEGALRHYDPAARRLGVSAASAEPSRTFQLAYQLATLEFGDLIEAELDVAGFRSRSARDVCRVGLTNYAAGALMLPYARFMEAALELRHDIERLQQRFGASFEQVCHRLSTLQRPGLRGVPFYFVRVDQAGNITKRHSATRFQFARFGGACPLWNVHSAFASPGEILAETAEMPDGVRYLCVAYGVIKPSGSYDVQPQRYALGLGCAVENAGSVVYADRLDLAARPVRIGVGCRICPREDCLQRAFPPADRSLHVTADTRFAIPYSLEH